MANDEALLEFVQAIAVRDVDVADGMLAGDPGLATQAISVGGSRSGPDGYFLSPVALQLYAGATALHVAAAAYDASAVRKLIYLGANVRAADRRGAEPLHCAVRGTPGSTSWDPEAQVTTIGALFEAGADLNAISKEGATPLHRAVRSRCSAAVEALLMHGADVHRRNLSGSTPLHLAVQTTGCGGTGSEASRAEQEVIIGLLLENGVDLTAKDGNSRTALDYARSARLQSLLSGPPTL